MWFKPSILSSEWGILDPGFTARHPVSEPSPARSARHGSPPAAREADKRSLFERIIDFIARGLHLGSDPRHRFELGIVAARLDERRALQRAAGHPRLELGEAVGDLVKAFSGDGHGSGQSQGEAKVYTKLTPKTGCYAG